MDFIYDNKFPTNLKSSGWEIKVSFVSQIAKDRSIWVGKVQKQIWNARGCIWLAFVLKSVRWSLLCTKKVKEGWKRTGALWGMYHSLSWPERFVSLRTMPNNFWNDQGDSRGLSSPDSARHVSFMNRKFRRVRNMQRGCRLSERGPHNSLNFFFIWKGPENVCIGKGSIWGRLYSHNKPKCSTLRVKRFWRAQAVPWR